MLTIKQSLTLQINKSSIILPNGSKLDIENIDVYSKEIIGIIGNNGSGKTTFFKCLLGLIPFSGTIKILGKNPGFNQNIGYMPQHPVNRFPSNIHVDSIMSNAINPWSMLWEYNTDIIDNALNITKAIEYKHKPFRCLSGGQKNRVILAICLINKPKILLLDEPLSNIDQESCKYLSHSLSKIAESGTTIIIISHEIKTIACNKIYHFNKGKVHLCENPSF